MLIKSQKKKELRFMILLKKHVITEEFRKRNRLSLIRKNQNYDYEEDSITVHKIEEMKIGITNKYTYLGKIKDSKCRMMPHLEEKKRKMLWMIKRIPGLIKEEVFWKTKPKTTLDLNEKAVIPAALYGCETWKMTCQEEKVIEDLQVQTLKNIIKLPKSTPTIAVLGETGCMRTKNRIHKRQLNYIYI